MNARGSIILDSVVAVAIFAILFTGFLALMQVGVKTLIEHKARAGALAIARSHIEHIRSIDYSVVGIQGGNPDGNIISVTNDTLNNIEYTIITNINWHDDEGDGLSSSDNNPNDYKSVRVQVEWSGHAGSVGRVQLSTFVADFVPE